VIPYETNYKTGPGCCIKPYVCGVAQKLCLGLELPLQVHSLCPLLLKLFDPEQLELFDPVAPCFGLCGASTHMAVCLTTLA
jgi:hypothetical protein